MNNLPIKLIYEVTVADFNWNIYTIAALSDYKVFILLSKSTFQLK